MGSKSSVPPESDIYDLSPEQSAPAKPMRPTAQPVALPYRTAPKKAAGLSTDTEVLKNVQIPLVLLTVGVVVQLVAAWFGEESMAIGVVGVAIGLVLGTAVTLVGVLIAARLRAIQLGKFRYTLLKLGALYVFPLAMLTVAMTALRFIPFLGPLIGLIGEFVLYFALLGVLFDLEESDTWYCVFIIFLVNLGVLFLLKYFLPM
jgi:hypothetical protein